MVYKPDFTINTESEQVNFLFTSYTFKAFCERKGIELEDLLQVVSKTITPKEQQDESLRDVQPFKTKDYPALLLAANEAWCVYHKTPFTAGEAEAYQWIDVMGGLVGGVNTRNELFARFVARLLNIDETRVEAKGEPEKNAEAPGQSLPGERSTEEPLKPV